LESLEVQPNQIKEILNCLLHTIMFSRAFGLVKPREYCIDFLELYYVRCVDEIIEKYIEEKIDMFVDTWKKKKFEPRKRLLVLSFDETRYRTQLFGLSKAEEKVRWERWVITLNIVKSAANDSQVIERKEKLEADLKRTLMHIIKWIDENKNHIPPLTKTDVTPFPYEISFPNPDESGAGLFAALGNMLKSTTTI